MKRLLTLTLTAASLLTACEKNLISSTAQISEKQNGIIGGQAALHTDAITSSTVSIMVNYDGSPFSICTGTLISQNLVLTATHCLDGMDASDLFIYFGANLPKKIDTKKLLKVADLRVHPKYEMIFDETDEDTPVTGLNDVGLIRLAQNAPDSARPVAIAKQTNILKPGMSLLLAGYGIVNEIGDPTYAKGLNYVRVPFVKPVFESILVTDQTNAQGACSGDSGGPAYVETPNGLIVVGITRGPHGQSLDCRHYGEYTSAAHFQGFIEDMAKELGALAPQFIDLPAKF